MALTTENSYVTLDEANAYFADSSNAAEWQALSNDGKEDALVSSTRVLDKESWVGVAVSTSQSLAFPRSGSYYDPKYGQVVYFDEEDTPSRVKEATFEMALHLLKNPDSLNSASTVKELKVGSIELKGLSTLQTVPSTASKLIRPVLNNTSNIPWRAW